MSIKQEIAILIGFLNYWAMFIMIIDVLINVISTGLLQYVGNYNCLLAYVIVKNIKTFFGKHYSEFFNKLVKNKSDALNFEAFTKYCNLTYESMVKLPIMEFTRKKKDAIRAIKTITLWGIPTCIEIVGIFAGCAYLVISNGLYKMALLILSINLLINKFVVSKNQIAFNDMRKKIKSANENLKTEISFAETMIPNQRDISNVITMETNLENNNYIADMVW